VAALERDFAGNCRPSLLAFQKAGAQVSPETPNSSNRTRGKVIKFKSTTDRQIEPNGAGAEKPGILGILQAALTTPGREKLAKWIDDTYAGTPPAGTPPKGIENYAVDLGGFSQAKRKWENNKFKCTREAEFRKSIAAKALAGWQEVNGDDRLKMHFEFENFFEWDLTGDLKKSSIESD
jgi:hypothetical protein